MSSPRKIAANRKNSERSTGPTNTANSRFNALRHGLFAAGVTELDNAESYERVLAELMREKQPAGVIETHRVQCMALDLIRQKRAHRLESEFIAAQLHPPKLESFLDDPSLAVLNSRVVDPGFPAALSIDAVREIVNVFQRCENFYANDLSRNERELERSQRMRLGERLPPPAVVDITVRAAESAKDVLVATQHERNTVVPNVLESFSETPPQNTRSCEIPNDATCIESQDAESSTNLSPSALACSVDHNWDSPAEPLWQNAPRKPLWSK